MRQEKIILIFVLASTTSLKWVKKDSSVKLECQVPSDFLQNSNLTVCSWKSPNHHILKSYNDEKTVSIWKNNNTCFIKIDDFQRRDEGVWSCYLKFWYS